MAGLSPETISAREQKHPSAHPDCLFFLLQMHLLVFQKLNLLGLCKIFQMDQLGGQDTALERSHWCFCGEWGVKNLYKPTQTHDAVLLLRNSSSIPKLLYLLHAFSQSILKYLMIHFVISYARLSTSVSMMIQCGCWLHSL